MQHLTSKLTWTKNP